MCTCPNKIRIKSCAVFCNLNYIVMLHFEESAGDEKVFHSFYRFVDTVTLSSQLIKMFHLKCWFTLWQRFNVELWIKTTAKLKLIENLMFKATWEKNQNCIIWKRRIRERSKSDLDTSCSYLISTLLITNDILYTQVHFHPSLKSNVVVFIVQVSLFFFESHFSDIENFKQHLRARKYQIPSILKFVQILKVGYYIFQILKSWFFYIF